LSAGLKDVIDGNPLEHHPRKTPGVAVKEHGPIPGDSPIFKLVIRNDWFCAAREHTARTQIDLGYLLGGPPG
jgi:hypothetical protein